MLHNRTPFSCRIIRLSPLSPLLYAVPAAVVWAHHQAAVVIIAAMLPGLVIAVMCHLVCYDHRRRRCDEGCQQPPLRPEGPTSRDRVIGKRLHRADATLSAAFKSLVATYAVTAIVLIPLGEIALPTIIALTVPAAAVAHLWIGIRHNRSWCPYCRSAPGGLPHRSRRNQPRPPDGDAAGGKPAPDHQSSRSPVCRFARCPPVSQLIYRVADQPARILRSEVSPAQPSS
ncbi:MULTISPECIES: hypothetical protein [Nocardia]|uniref:hypothetical protein n=1 Tax=Nocardia TaxID=1817 RepID=UPI000FE1F448|nr:hypothetical protein [Nocardia africana]MCC3317951.1 hypothetical protein [Nocardia africana]